MTNFYELQKCYEDYHRLNEGEKDICARMINEELIKRRNEEMKQKEEKENKELEGYEARESELNAKEGAKNLQRQAHRYSDNGRDPRFFGGPPRNTRRRMKFGGSKSKKQYIKQRMSRKTLKKVHKAKRR